MLKRMLCIAIIATIFCYSASMGETIINGPLTESQIWTQAGSPYIIQGVVSASNISLEILPGTTVLFDPGARLVIYGDHFFTAQGTEAEPILFSSNSASPQPDDYLGLALVYGLTATMSHCVIEYARDGISLSTPLTTVESVEIRNCVNGLVANLGVQGIVSGFNIHDNTGYGIECDVYSDLIIRDCVISANGSTGIQSWSPSRVGADQCTIQNNGFRGMIATGDVTNCNISGNGGIGLVIDGSGGTPIVAHHNTIIGNSGSGVWIAGFISNNNEPQINWCSIHDNGDYDIELHDSCLYPTVDATHNFWNTQDAEIISARILDSNDDPTLTSEVIFTPFEGSVATERKTLGEIKSLYR